MVKNVEDYGILIGFPLVKNHIEQSYIHMFFAFKIMSEILKLSTISKFEEEK